MLKGLFSRRPSLDVGQVVQQAWTLRDQGKLNDAEQLCRSALAAQPDHFDALHLLGLVMLQLGRPAEGERAFAAALAQRPDATDTLINRGAALTSLNRLQDALASFEQAQATDPASADIEFNRAAVLLALGQPAAALEGFDRAVALRPQFVEALCNRARALRVLGRNDEAVTAFAEALVLQPDHFDSLANLGHALDEQGRVEQALDAYDRALAIRPESATTRNDRATVLIKLGRHAEALRELDQALSVDPGFVPALMSRGNALHLMGRSEEALEEIDKAIALEPEYAGAPYNRGIILHSLGRLDEAIAAYDWACAIKPDFAQALSNRGNLESERNRHDDALASYESVLTVDPDYPFAAGNVAFERAQLCLWDDRDRINARAMDGIARGKPVCAPLAMLALTDDAALQHACARIHMAHHHLLLQQPLWTKEMYGHDRIRIAYLSADFHEHALAFLIAGLLEQHDHRRFEITAIEFGPDVKGPMRSRIDATFDRIIDARKMGDEEVAREMRSLEIEIAIDLMGFTRHSRPGILACRPAPVQVTYLGYPGTIGSPCIDYIVADRFVIPDTQRAHYAESVVYLPDTFQANDVRRRIADATPSRAAVGLPEQGFVFCSFNRNYKITPEVFDVWMRLLRGTPGSVLWLVGDSESVTRNLRREAQQRDVAPERLVFAPRLPYPEYLASYRLADLFLDTLPFNGGTTASDALWAGLPVLTCAGDAFAARMAGSLLQAVGLPELITHTMNDYEALALRLAADPAHLASIRQTLASNRDNFPLFDTDRFRRNMESAFMAMWEKYRRGERPESFAVPA